MQTSSKYHIAKSNIANSFAHAAVTYDEYASLQREVADKLLANINKVKAPTKILDLGSGTGYCSKKLLEIFPAAEIVSLDIAEGMLAYSKSTGSGQFVCADAEALPFIDSSFDLIVSSLAVQWCQNYPKLFNDLFRVLRAGGGIYLSTFGPETLKELRLAWKKVDDYIHVNEFYKKEALEEIVGNITGSRIEIRDEIIMSHYESLKKLTQELKFIGAHNMNQGQAKGLGGRGKVSQVKKNFEACYIPEQGIPVSYELYYLYLSKVV